MKITKKDKNLIAKRILTELKGRYSKEEIEGIRKWLYNYQEGRRWLSWRAFEEKFVDQQSNEGEKNGNE